MFLPQAVTIGPQHHSFRIMRKLSRLCLRRIETLHPRPAYAGIARHIAAHAKYRLHHPAHAGIALPGLRSTGRLGVFSAHAEIGPASHRLATARMPRDKTTGMPRRRGGGPRLSRALACSDRTASQCEGIPLILVWTVASTPNPASCGDAPDVVVVECDAKLPPRTCGGDPVTFMVR